MYHIQSTGPGLCQLLIKYSCITITPCESSYGVAGWGDLGIKGIAHCCEVPQGDRLLQRCFCSWFQREPWHRVGPGDGIVVRQQSAHSGPCIQCLEWELTEWLRLWPPLVLSTEPVPAGAEGEDTEEALPGVVKCAYRAKGQSSSAPGQAWPFPPGQAWPFPPLSVWTLNTGCRGEREASASRMPSPPREFISER